MTWLTVGVLLCGCVAMAAVGCSTNEAPKPSARSARVAAPVPSERSSAAEPRPVDEPPASGDPRTDKLRAELDKVRKAIAAKGDKGFAAGPVSPEHRDAWPLDALRRMHRREIRVQLGAPRACDERWVTPCKSSGDWVYAFYYLPKNYWGGGPELLLEFDSNGRCKAASWAFTR